MVLLQDVQFKEKLGLQVEYMQFSERKNTLYQRHETLHLLSSKKLRRENRVETGRIEYLVCKEKVKDLSGHQWKIRIIGRQIVHTIV